MVQVLPSTSLGLEPGAAVATGEATTDGVGHDPGWAGLQPPGMPGMDVKVAAGDLVVVSK
jgi:hypothetical protein